MEKTTRQDSRIAIRKNCGQNYIFVVLHFNLFGLAKQATSRTHLIEFLPSINEEDSYRFSDSRSLMSKLPRRVSASAGLPKGVQLGFCTFSKRSIRLCPSTYLLWENVQKPSCTPLENPAEAETPEAASSCVGGREHRRGPVSSCHFCKDSKKA